jgi:hypothetical protein
MADLTDVTVAAMIAVGISASIIFAHQVIGWSTLLRYNFSICIKRGTNENNNNMSYSSSSRVYNSTWM